MNVEKLKLLSQDKFQATWKPSLKPTLPNWRFLELWERRSMLINIYYIAWEMEALFYLKYSKSTYLEIYTSVKTTSECSVQFFLAHLWLILSLTARANSKHKDEKIILMTYQ